MNIYGIVIIPLIRYDGVQNKCKSIVRQAKEKYERITGLAYMNNPTLFWKYVQRILQIPTGISSLLDGNSLVSSEKDKDNFLNMYFSRIYAEENINNLPVAYRASHSYGGTLSDVVITPRGGGV